MIQVRILYDCHTRIEVASQNTRYQIINRIIEIRFEKVHRVQRR